MLKKIKPVLLIIPVLLLIFGFSVNTFGQVAVIANKSVTVNSISSEKLLDIYSREILFWDNDDPLVVFDLKPKTEVKKAFYEYIGKSTSRMKTIWMKKKLAGEGDPPESLSTEKEILEKVSVTRGAVGYISASEVDSTVNTLFLITGTKEKQIKNSNKKKK